MNSQLLEELSRVDVAESDGDEWVEVYMEVNHSGDACEPFMVEWFPAGESPTNNTLGRHDTRVINQEVFDCEAQQEYEKFAAIVGMLTLHE